MSASTSTVTTSKKASNGTTTLETKPEGKTDASPLSHKEQEFFWTYTEEPHRTRRMAIIKAHPEVLFPSKSPRNTPTDPSTGNQTLWTGAPNEIRRPLRRLHPNTLRIPPTRHLFLLVEVLPHILHNWRDCQPEPLFGHPRNLA